MLRFGIDLGTTNTVIYEAFYPTGGGADDFSLHPVTIQYQEEGDVATKQFGDSMPSAIYARKRAEGDYTYYLGTIAVMMAKRDQSTQIINTKRLMSRNNPDQIVEYGLTAQGIAQKLLEGCRYSIEQSNRTEGQRRFAQYCITQPAAFGLFASTGIQQAANRAGFRRTEAQREPIAALLSYLYDILTSSQERERLFERQRKHGGRLLTLVVDIGGGTTDVTIQEIRVSGTEESVQGIMCCTGYKVEFLNQVRREGQEDAPVASANVEPAFGGLDFDKEIVGHIQADLDRLYTQRFGSSYNWNDYEGNRNLVWLYQWVQDYKIRLSNFPEDDNYDNDQIMLNGEFFPFHLTARQVYQWTKPLCESSIGERRHGRTVYGIITDTVRRSGYRVEDIDILFVTGGMSNYYPIKQMLQEKFKRQFEDGVLQFSRRPLDDIARGAAVCNCYFQVEMPPTVLYADLMIDDPCGTPLVLVRRNVPLPAEDTMQNFMVVRNPANLYIDVLWGQGPNDCKLERLRRLKTLYPDRKPVRVGSKVSVHYKIDAHQAMDVELLVHAPDGEMSIPLLQLIRDLDLSRGEKDNG